MAFPASRQVRSSVSEIHLPRCVRRWSSAICRARCARRTVLDAMRKVPREAFLPEYARIRL